MLTGFAASLLVLCLLVLSLPAQARDLGQWASSDPSVRAWFRSLMQPEMAAASCCREAGGDLADESEVRDGGVLATITDDRDDGGLDAECKVITARLMAATNAEFDHTSPSGGSVFLKAPKMVLNCNSQRLTGISMGWDASGPPPDEWFGLLAKAGKAVTGVDVSRLVAVSRECYRTALKDKAELTNPEIPKSKAGRQAFTRECGGVSISIGAM